jgi:hypothetical protein
MQGALVRRPHPDRLRGIAFVLLLEGLWLRTGDPLYQTIAKRWSKVMLAPFAVGVVTGDDPTLRAWPPVAERHGHLRRGLRPRLHARGLSFFRVRACQDGHGVARWGLTTRPGNRLSFHFRKANQRLLAAIKSRASAPRRLPFLCECADDACLESVDVEMIEWEAVASRHNHFLMVAGHQHSEGEEVVGRVGEYEVARKPG